MEERNRHHTFWERSWYRSKTDRRFRNHNGLVIPIDIEVHKELHATINPPLKPEQFMLHQCVQLLNQAEKTEPLWGLRVVSEYLETRSPRIYDQLQEQIGFLVLNNQVEEVLHGAA